MSKKKDVPVMVFFVFGRKKYVLQETKESNLRFKKTILKSSSNTVFYINTSSTTFRLYFLKQKCSHNFKVS